LANHKAVNSRITVYPSIQKGVAKMKTVITRWLLWLAGLSVLFAGYSMALAYSVNDYAECAIAGWVPYGAVVEVYEVDLCLST